jgi:serine/threonine protein kinase
MESSTFFEHYRIAVQADGSPIEIRRSGPAVFYKAFDLRSGAPVVLTLVPKSSVDAEAREGFEERSRAALELDHVNIGKIFAFGIEDDQFAFVSEFPQGEMVDSWIAENGPMSPDAVLRVGLQVMSALGAASFYNLTHRAIQPSNLKIVPGQTPEGGWPFIKLMNFGLAGLKGGAAGEGPEVEFSPFASPEQVEQGTSDFRSEIYSLGATMCFLLTGVFYAAEPRSLQTRRFARSLRNLITPMLQQDPEDRPSDPLLVTQALRKCLAIVERRQNFARKFGIPFAAVVAKPARRIVVQEKVIPVPLAPVTDTPLPVPLAMLPAARVATPSPAPVETSAAPHAWFSRRGLALAALLLGLAVVAAALLPAPVSMILGRNRDKGEIGVPVGLPEPSPPQVAQNSSSAAPTPVRPSSASNFANATPAQAPIPAVAPSAPIGNSASSDKLVAGAPAPAPASVPNQASAIPQSAGPPAAQPSTKSGELVAANTKETKPNDPAKIAEAEPPPPAQGPQTVWDRATGTEQKLNTQKQAAEGDVASTDSEQPSPKTGQSDAEPDSSPRTASVPRSKTKATASDTRHSGSSSNKSRIAQSSPYDTDTDMPPRFREHTVHARYVGMTPDGNLILRLPSGETAIVSPRNARLTVPGHRRVRRMVEQPPIYFPPRQPFYDPGY